MQGEQVKWEGGNIKKGAVREKEVTVDLAVSNPMGQRHGPSANFFKWLIPLESKSCQILLCRKVRPEGVCCA